MATEEQREIARVLQALIDLKDENPAWGTNFRKFARLDSDGRVWWWTAFKKQAEAGAPAPRTLLVKVIQLRLTK